MSYGSKKINPRILLQCKNQKSSLKIGKIFFLLPSEALGIHASLPSIKKPHYNYRNSERNQLRKLKNNGRRLERDLKKRDFNMGNDANSVESNVIKTWAQI